MEDVRIICIGGLHWVALTSHFYYDHDQCYQVLDHSTCLTTLNQMNTYEVPADPRKTHNVKTKEEYHLAEVKITSRTTRTRLNSWIDKFATPKKTWFIQPIFLMLVMVIFEPFPMCGGLIDWMHLWKKINYLRWWAVLGSTFISVLVWSYKLLSGLWSFNRFENIKWNEYI